MKKIVIAIDGVSSTGKSTMAKDLAKEIGYTYIDTGAMYRAVTLYCIQHNLFKGDQIDEEKLQAAMGDIHISLRFNPETDRYSSDIRMNEDGYQVHLENRPLMEEDLVQLDESTAHDLKNETALAGYTDLSEEDLKYLDKNTPSTEGLRIVPPGEKQEDFLRPLGNQEDMRGEYHPDGWTNPKELKDGDIYYQLVPGVGNGEKIYSSYFTDKETIDSCRDNDGNIVLSSLMQKLQKQPNMETRSDSDGNSQETYVEEYSIVQYKFKQNPEDT